MAPASTTRSLPALWTPLTFGLFAGALAGIVALVSPNIGAAVVNASVACAVLALLGFVSLFIDVSANRTRWLLAMLIVVAVGVFGLLLSGPAYDAAIAQAKSHGDYTSAVSMQRAQGQKEPYSQTLAQTYLDWGKAELQANNYPEALKQLTYVAQKFPTTVQAAQAQTLLPGAHLAAASYAASHNDPVTAGQEYNILLTQYSTSPEAEKAHDAAPAAFLAWGDALFQKGYYQQGYDAYQLIAKNFASSSQAAQAHTQAAKLLSEWAQKLNDAHRYADASPHLTDLAQNYSDTPEGQQAQKTLSQGEPVIGQLFKDDGKTPAVGVTVRLSSSWKVANGTYTVSGQQYLAKTDANGYFEFPAVPAGQYILEWHNTQGTWLTIFNGTTPVEVITLQPLVPSTLTPVVTNLK